MGLSRALPAALFALLLAFNGRAKAAEHNWQCYTYLPAATDPAYQALADFATEISKASDGKLNVACHVGGSLPINASTIAQSIAGNVLQLGLVDSLSYNSLVPAAGAMSLPGLFPSGATLQEGITALMPMLNPEFAKRNIIVLGIASYPLQVIYGTGKITALSDLKNLKIRVTTPEQAEFAVRFGATPVTLGAPDVATSLQRGIIQAVLTSNVGGGIVWHGLLHYNLRTGPNYVSVMLLVNKQQFDALPPALQETVSKLGLEAAAKITHVLQSREVGLTEEFRKEGMVITPGTAADRTTIADRMRSYWPQWAQSRGTVAQQALTTLQQALQH
jgi:TRAP-type C4-dicarboxylate transport system substrate-binding protein